MLVGVVVVGGEFVDEVGEVGGEEELEGEPAAAGDAVDRVDRVLEEFPESDVGVALPSDT